MVRLPRTLKLTDAVAVRLCASWTEIGMSFGPPVRFVGISAWYVKVLAGPSAKDWVPDPLIALRSPVTVNPLLVGLIPGVTLTVMLTVSPPVTEFLSTEATADGLVGAEVALIVPESTEVSPLTTAWMTADPSACGVKVALRPSEDGTRSVSTMPPVFEIKDQVAGALATNPCVTSREIA